MRHREPLRAAVLCAVRYRIGGRLPQLRHGKRSRRSLLRRVRHRARHGRVPSPRAGSAAGLRTAPGLGAVRRPRRIHDALGVPRPRGGPRAPGPVLRSLPHPDRAIRRHRREVHRRRGDGRLGIAGGARGRRRAGGAGRPRDHAGGHRARGRGRHAGPSRQGGRADGIRRRGDRCPQRGDGDGRHRQRRLAAPGDRGARNGPRGRRSPTRTPAPTS